MKTMRIEPLHCHTTCGELKCPICRYSAGEFHHAIVTENGELSAWANLRHSEGDVCPNCGWRDEIEAAS